MYGLMLPSATSPTPKNFFLTLGKNGGNQKTPDFSTSLARIISCSTASYSLQCSRQKAPTSSPTTCLLMSSSIWKTTRFPLLATGRYGCTNISRISLVNKTCSAMCSQLMLPKPRITTSLGRTSKRAITTNLWRSMVTS